ncbi:MAG: ectoine/hydroxyectoine ABC transporter permease subunit EhuC [Planctomycetota bacterium]
MQPEFQLSIAIDFLARGLLWTLVIFAGAAVLGLVLSLMIGLARISRHGILRWPAMAHTEVFRGTSALVQLFWFFYALPLMIGLNLTPITAAITVLALNTSAYGAEVVRGAIQAVPRGQSEAATALGLTRMQTVWRIVVPQAVPAMLPPFGNLLIEQLKNSALAYIITVPELTRQAEKLWSNFPTLKLELMLALLCTYFIIALGITGIIRLSEHLSSRGIRAGAGRE